MSTIDINAAGDSPARNASLIRQCFLPAALIALVAAGYAGWTAWEEHKVRQAPLDLDGWGLLVGRMQRSSNHLDVLFSEPSLWKGPIVPFVFGLCYWIMPFPESVLAFNAIAFALAAGGLFLTFCSLGASRLSSAGAILLWVFYLPHRIVFGYYLAEPFLALNVTLLLAVASQAILKKRTGLALLAGGLSGLLLLARASFVLAVCGLFVLLLWHGKGRRTKIVSLFAVGFLVTFTPWMARNYVVYHEFVPFTTEGGKILFQGVYLPGDDAIMGSYVPEVAKKLSDTLRDISEYVELEKGEEGKSPIEKYRYWKALAWNEIQKDPLGQAQLCVRKALRFWVSIPTHSWAPGWKTSLIAAISLPLAVIGVGWGRSLLLVQLCVVFVAGLWAFHALVHSELRYNFPALPLMFMLALVGLRYVWCGLRISGNGHRVTSRTEATV